MKKLKLKKYFKIIARNILRPHKIINAVGNKFINPMLNDKMIFQPYEIDIEPNTKCDLTCIFCQVPGWERSKVKDLDFCDFQKIIERFPFLLEIKTQGMGEPFLNRDIFKMIEYAKAKGIEFRITTNGITLNEEKINRLFENPPFAISFSLDTPDGETYKEIRGKDMFDKVVRNIEIAVKERNRTRSDTEINIWCLLNKYNVNRLLKLAELAKHIQVDNLVIQTKLASFGKDYIKNRNDAIRVNIADEEIREVLKNAGSFSKKIGLNLVIYTGNYFSKDSLCPGIKTHTYISAEGEVVPCCVLGDPRIISMGNIYQVKNFSKIWNNNKYRQLRIAINKNQLPVFCKYCYTE